MISKAKAKLFQKICSSFFSKTRPSELFSLLCSISASFSSSSSSDIPNFPSCHILVDCANRLFTHLQFHFTTQIPNFFQSFERLYMNKVRSADRLTSDQALLLSSHSITYSFYQSTQGARTVFATVDFAKAFDSFWHSTLIFKLLSIGLTLFLLYGYDLCLRSPFKSSYLYFS